MVIPYLPIIGMAMTAGYTKQSGTGPVVPQPQPLSLTRDVDDIEAVAGTDVTWTIQASGGKPPYSYQWFFVSGGPASPIDTTINPSAATASLLLTSTNAAAQGGYMCIVTDAAGGTINSSLSILTVNDIKPIITIQPTAKGVMRHYVLGNTIILHCEATNTPNAIFRWETMAPGADWVQAVDGKEASFQAIDPTTATNMDGTQIRCRVINGNAETYSNVVTLVRVFLWVRNDINSNTGASALAAGSPPLKNDSTGTIKAGDAYLSAYYYRFSDDTVYVPEGLTSARVVPTRWEIAPPTAGSVKSTSPTGAVVFTLKTGMASVTAFLELPYGDYGHDDAMIGEATITIS